MPDMIDSRTEHYGLPVPVFDGNTQDYDIPRTAEAFALVDAALAALAAAVAGKAPAEHTHAMGAIIGLVEALADKAALAHLHALDDLSDVDAADPANSMVIKRVGTRWVAATLNLGDVPSWEGTVDAKIAEAIASLAGAAPAALDTFAELAAALGSDPAFATTISTALGYRLRFDAAQTLSPAQRAQALTNLGVTAFIRGLLDDASASEALTTLGVTPFVRSLLDDANADALLTTLGFGAGIKELLPYSSVLNLWLGIKQPATAIVTGVVELATNAEAVAGTDAARAVTPAALKAVTAALATLDSPTFTGTPSAPSPASTDNDTSIATTAFTQHLIATKVLIQDRAGLYAAIGGSLGQIGALAFGTAGGNGYGDIVAGSTITVDYGIGGITTTLAGGSWRCLGVPFALGASGRIGLWQRVS